MSFAAPLNLLALLVIPLVALLAVYAKRRRHRFAVRHPGTAIVAGVLPTVPRWRRVLPVALLGLAAAALALAFARPEATVAVPVEQASVVLVTDESGSMRADDVQPSRLAAAQRAARSFLDQVPDQLLVGFVGYSDAVHAQVEPTTDHDQVGEAVDALNADAGTATGDALTAALDRLEARRGKDGRTAPAAIVLLSDGKTTVGSDPQIAAARAAKLHIPISTVALGTDDGFVTGPNGEAFAVPPDPETLRAVARRSGGRAYEISDAGELDKVYEQLGSRIGVRHEQHEVGVLFAAGGLAFLLGGLGTGRRRWGALA